MREEAKKAGFRRVRMRDSRGGKADGVRDFADFVYNAMFEGMA
jgi:hypothetical protein